MGKKQNTKNNKKKQVSKEDELISLLRKSLPNKIVVEEFKDKIVNHKFHTTKFFKKIDSTHENYSWAKRNVEGELFEALISEVLFEWAKTTNDVNKFVLKNPYAGTKEVENGFGYDRRRITLFGDGDPIAEFDALFQFKDKWFFVEVTTTTLRYSLKEFLEDVARKRKILKHIFNTEEVYSLLVTIVPNLFHRNDLTKYDLNYYFPLDEELLTCMPDIDSKGKIVKLKEKNPKLILAYELETTNLGYKKLRALVRKQFKKYYKGKITAKEFFERIDEAFGIVQHFMLGSLPNTSIHKFHTNKMLKKQYAGFGKKQVKRIVVGVKLIPRKHAELRLYIIPSKKKYYRFLESFSWKDRQFKKREKVLKKKCILLVFDPKLDVNDLEYWSQLGKACNELKIPKLRKS